jgi:hypothetical protein
MRAIAILVASALVVCTSTAGNAYLNGPLPADFGGGILPPSADSFQRLQGARAAVTKLRLGVAKCYEKGAASYAAGKATGIDACLHDAARGALVRYAATIESLLAKPGSLPDCAGFQFRGAAIAEAMRQLNASAYCGPPVTASPDGAFLDGPATL